MPRNNSQKQIVILSVRLLVGREHNQAFTVTVLVVLERRSGGDARLASIWKNLPIAPDFIAQYPWLAGSSRAAAMCPFQFLAIQKDGGAWKLGRFA